MKLNKFNQRLINFMGAARDNPYVTPASQALLHCNVIGQSAGKRWANIHAINKSAGRVFIELLDQQGPKSQLSKALW